MANTVVTTTSTLGNINYTITGGMNTMIGSNGTYYSTIGTTYSTVTPAMSVKGDLDVDGNITVKGKDLVKILEQIENRFAILSDPDPKKIEKFEALKKAYNHYKLMEKLIGED